MGSSGAAGPFFRGGGNAGSPAGGGAVKGPYRGGTAVGIRPGTVAESVPAPASDPADLVDLERYPLLDPESEAYTPASWRQARRQLRASGAAEIPGFLSPAGVAALVRDADALAPRAHPSGGQGTAYLEFPDFSLPADHPRLQFADYRVRAVAYDISRSTRRCAGSTSGTRSRT